MTQLQEEYVYALKYFGFEIKEITKRDLDIVYQAYSERLNPETTPFEEYKNGYEYKTMLKYYNLLSDIRKTNEVIDSILNPKVEEIKNAEILDNYEPKNENTEASDFNQDFSGAKLNPAYTKDGILDRPTVLSSILSVLMPIYGFLVSAFTWRITPKAAKWYLVFAVIGVAINAMIYFLEYYFLFR